MTAAITVTGLSKRYQLGELHRDTMLREALANWIKRPFSKKEKMAKTDEVLWALKDISFSVDAGEVVGIIGRNGAGKSTLLKVLSRITYPTEGGVKVDGRIASLLEVGTGFHAELTGRENVFLNGSILGMTKKEINARLEEIVEFAGVSRFIDTPIKRYSTGMRLRLGFAVAAHLDPDVLLVDEVLAVGDAGFQKKCLDTMRDLRTSGRTVLFVSHNMAAIENLCTRAIRIEGGMLVDDGPSEQVIRTHLATFGDEGQTSRGLEDVSDRRGTGEAKFTGIDILSPDGQPIEVVRSGDAIKIRLSYQATKRIQNPHFGVEIYSDLGTRVTEASTYGNGFDIPELEPGTGTIDLDIEFLNLMPSRYYISLWLEAVGPVHYDVLDRCHVIDIETSNYYRSGRGIDAKHGLIFLPCSWQRSEATVKP